MYAFNSLQILYMQENKERKKEVYLQMITKN